MKGMFRKSTAKRDSTDAQGKEEPLIAPEGNETELTTQRAATEASDYLRAANEASMGESASPWAPTAIAPLDAGSGSSSSSSEPDDTNADEAGEFSASPLAKHVAARASSPIRGPPMGRGERRFVNPCADVSQVIEDPVTPPSKYHGSFLQGTAGRDGREEIASKIPSQEGLTRAIRGAILVVTSAPILYGITFFVMASGMLYGVLRRTDLFNNIDWDQNLNVAFIGESYFFVNDIPRLMEAISDGHIYQDSCIHAGGSLSALLATGNGMYNRWATDEAMLYSANENYKTYGGDQPIYDFGSCSIPQLLTGYDENLAYGNSGGLFYDDGGNPCLRDPYYLSFLNDTAPSSLNWDYVVLADQTKRMAISSARADAISALTNKFAPLLKTIKATPVIVDTHAFWSDSSNMTGLTDIPTFTSLLREGVQDYVDALKAALPSRQAPLVAPIGLAYLTIYEEDYELWQQLFLDDQIHSSVHGSYLFACVLYCTLFKHLPPETNPLPEDLFKDARKLMGQPQYPSYDETVYLNNVARRVALHGYVPSSLNRL
jgi:hypothetical protein